MASGLARNLHHHHLTIFSTGNICRSNENIMLNALVFGCYGINALLSMQTPYQLISGAL